MSLVPIETTAVVRAIVYWRSNLNDQREARTPSSLSVTQTSQPFTFSTMSADEASWVPTETAELFNMDIRHCKRRKGVQSEESGGELVWFRSGYEMWLLQHSVREEHCWEEDVLTKGQGERRRWTSATSERAALSNQGLDNTVSRSQGSLSLVLQLRLSSQAKY